MPLSYYTEFITGTIYNWEHPLKDDDCKQIVIDSLHWLTKNKKCTVNAFVIMPNHFHMLPPPGQCPHRTFFNHNAHHTLKKKNSANVGVPLLLQVLINHQ